MFECKKCQEKDKFIEFLKAQNKDLYDRLMAFNNDAFVHYKAETKQGELLYPFGIDEKGKLFDYKEANLEEAGSDALRAMGEQPVNVEEKQGEN